MKEDGQMLSEEPTFEGRISACGGSRRAGAAQMGNGNGRPRSERGNLPEQGLERRIGG